jgi:tetratricopeptide (TPR) repeat protein
MKGDDLFAKGMFNESLAAYNKSIALDRYSFKSWEGKGKALLALGRFDDAAKAFLQALKLDPSDGEAYALLGDAQNAAGKYQEAAEYYVKALAMNPKMEGITEKLSAVYAAEQLALSSGNETNITTQMNATSTNTLTVTVEETTVAVPTTTKAGFPGAITGIMGILVCLVLMGYRKK